MKIKKDKIIKYKEFLKESLDPYKLKIGIKSFNRQKEDVYTINGDLKELSNKLSEEFKLLILPYHKLIEFGGLEFDLIIKQTNKYYSSIDWNKFLNNDNEIIIEVPKDYDINYLVSIIVHEFRHIIDFTDENMNSGLSSFDLELNLRKYNVGYFRDFFILFYISLEHELIARNNQIYPYIKFKELTKEQSLSILKNSFIWNSLEQLENFNIDSFMSKFKQDYLLNITNQFIKDVLCDNETIIENYNELKHFYDLFNDYFKETSNKWKSVLFSEVDKIYERKIYNYNESYNYKIILEDVWSKLKIKL